MRELRVVLCAMALVVMVVPANAQQPNPESEGSILLIMDASGSMGQEGPDGERRIDAAKTALLRLVDALPDRTSVGLRVYGHRVPNTDKTNGCRDTELVVPVGPLDRQQMREAIGGFEARGFTPIGLSLQQAVEDLTTEGRRTVVLVSDGEDTCAPPEACEVAQQIINDGVDLRAETLGLLIEPGSVAEAQLQCIADVTGGGYRTVGEIDLLAGVLSDVVGAAVGGPRVTPRILDGSTARTEAPRLAMLAPTLADELDNRTGAGLWRGLILPGETRWWAVELSGDEYLDVSGALFRPVDLALAPGEHFELTLLNPELEVVGFDRPGFGPTRAPVVDPAVSAEVWATMGNITEVTGEPPLPLVAGTHYIGFAWGGIDGTALAEVEFMVETLSDRGRSGEPEAAGNGFWEAEFLGFIGGGVEIAEAPLVTVPPYPGPAQDKTTTYNTRNGGFRTHIAQGETLWYAVDLSGGEDMLVTVTGDLGSPGAVGATGELGLQITDPNGDSVGEFHPLIGPERIDLAFVESSFVIGSTSEIGTIGPVDGRHFVAVQWSASPGLAELDLKVNFDVVIVPNATFGGDDAGKADDAGEAAEQPATNGNSRPIPFVILGGLVVALGATGLGVMRRRRNSDGA